MAEFKSFNAGSVSLEGTNLIEASAGTGKTYSIAILALRLILEKRLSVKEILMVTFTKAAVAELEERIRLFIRLGYRASVGEVIEDATILSLVNNEIQRSTEAEVQQVLKEAVLFLDETSVLTIHSFCQQTLTEFAFETRQLFGAELLQDTAALLEAEVNKFWRTHITGIPADVLAILIEAGLTRGSITQILKEHLGGKRYLLYQDDADYCYSEDHYRELSASFAKMRQKRQQLWDCLLDEVRNNSDQLKEAAEKNKFARNQTLDLIDQPDKLLDFILKNLEKKYVNSVYESLSAGVRECIDLDKELKTEALRVVRNLYCHAIKEVKAGVELTKRMNNSLAFDDLITGLHKVLVADANEPLVANLQRKYKAVFIDEFQDTDKLQFEIFQRAFGENTILFFIGDPKQSIYAWRKADIATYFRAKDFVQNLYGMNQNYRSSAGLIEAMNRFFLPNAGFDTFRFEGAADAIEYIPVESPQPNTKGTLLYDGGEASPITITELAKKDLICDAVALEVLDLLTNDKYLIEAKGTRRRIKPADIGVLVRSNREAQDVKAKLSARGIPAITIDDAKVLGTEESQGMLFLLEAMTDISRASINRALIGPFTALSEGDILKLDDELVVERFREYKSKWEKQGVLAALNGFITDFGVKSALLEAENGERKITNLYQLTELLHKVQSRKMLSPPELISWLKRGNEGMATEGDEFEQRIESDEEAVNIVTIHKSKGLEYKIVLAPFLDLKTESKMATHYSFRDSSLEEYVSAEKDLLTPEQKTERTRQAEQENRRLIYVAITRGVYKCFIYKSLAEKNSSLSPFMEGLDGADTAGLIERRSEQPMPAAPRYYASSAPLAMPAAAQVDFVLLEKNWLKMSYSRLRTEHGFRPKLRTGGSADPYDAFIFSGLKTGARTGNMLHYIFEDITFSDDSRWKYVVEQAALQYMGSKQEGDTNMLLDMLNHVMNARLVAGSATFNLRQLKQAHCIHEFEFDFNVGAFLPSELNRLSDENCPIEVKGREELEGVMNGKMDLFFEHEGRFYVLDWKSNFLGDSLSHYTQAQLQEAMNENNYHLQYLIYTLAASKYLQSRMPGFDYEQHFGGVIYLFVRGLRAGQSSGVYATRPSWEKIHALDRLLRR